MVPNHVRYQLRYTPKTSQDLLAENRLSAVADRLFGFVFSYYTMFVSKSQDFSASFSALVKPVYICQKACQLFFVSAPKSVKNMKSMKSKWLKKVSAALLAVLMAVCAVPVRAKETRAEYDNKGLSLCKNYANDIVAAAKALIGKTAAQPECIKSCCADFACECAISRSPKSKQDKK